MLLKHILIHFSILPILLKCDIENWETGKLGNWETGKLGNWETGKLGNWETGKLGNW